MRLHPSKKPTSSITSHIISFWLVSPVHFHFPMVVAGFFITPKSRPIDFLFVLNTLNMYYLRKKKTASKSTRSKPDLKAKLDRVFSLYIRLRDTMPGGYFRCISCGQIKPFEQADCGHYFSRTHLATRFDERNCHAECRSCNRFKADHLEGYRVNLIKKIGEKQFELLKWKSAQTCKMSDFEYRELIKYYQALTNKLKEKRYV